MNIQISWWMVCIGLIIAPIVYALLRKPGGDYDFQIDTALIAAVCWMFALGLFIGKVF